MELTQRSIHSLRHGYWLKQKKTPDPPPTTNEIILLVVEWILSTAYKFFHCDFCQSVIYLKHQCVLILGTHAQKYYNFGNNKRVGTKHRQNLQIVGKCPLMKC